MFKLEWEAGLVRMVLRARARRRWSVRFSSQIYFGWDWFTLGGTGLLTSPPSDSLELALRRAEDLERRYRALIVRIVESDGYFFLDRDGCAQLLRARSGRR
jgi:hypothetical protein